MIQNQKELTFQEHHPTLDEYLGYSQKQKKLISFEVIQKLLPNGIQLEYFEEDKSSQGVINWIYYLKVKDSTPLLLRVANSHKFWRGFSVEHHVYVHQLVQSKTNIPLAKIRGYGRYTSPENKDLFFEYILFDLLQEVQTLGTYNNEKSQNLLMDLEFSKQIISQGLEIVQQIQSIQVPQLIGAFNLNGDVVGIINDGPRSGPFCTISDYLVDLVQYSLKEFDNINLNIKKKDHHSTEELLYTQYGYIKQEIFQKGEQILSYIDSSFFQKYANQQFYLSHNDLNPSNILINPKTLQIVAVLDWDSAFVAYANRDIDYVLETWVSEQEAITLTEWYQKEKEIRKLVKAPKQLIELENLVNHLKWATFWVTSWWRDYPEEEYPSCIISERKQNLENFLESFQKFNFEE